MASTASAGSRSAAPVISETISTSVGVMARTRDRQRTAMLPSFTRLVMSGSTHALTVRSKPSPKWTSVTVAPARQHSSAASTLLFPAPITMTRRCQ